MVTLSRAIIFGIVAIVITYLIRQHLRVRRHRSFARRNGCLAAPRFPQKENFIGWELFRSNLKALKERKLLETMTDRFRIVGSHTFQSVVLGRSSYITMEPENLKALQSTNFRDWRISEARTRPYSQLLGASIFTTDGSEWRHSRNMMRPSFTKDQLITSLQLFERHVLVLLDAISQAGDTVDLADLFFRFTMDVSTEHLFGESTATLVSQPTIDFAGAFSRAQKYITMLARFGALARFFTDSSQFNQDRALIRGMIERYVEIALSKNAQGYKEKEEETGSRKSSFIDELAERVTDRVKLRDELLSTLFAGRDTTASLLTNVWFVLASRNDIWQRLQEDVNTLDGRPPTLEQLKNLTYVNAVLKESLRLYPVVPINTRETVRNTTLPRGGGPDGSAPLFLKQGSVMAWCTYAMHRRVDLYGDDAEQFRPERWLASSGSDQLKGGWEWLPFNGGPRVCLGQEFAMTEAAYVTTRLCQAFTSIENAQPDATWTEDITLTCVNLWGAKVKLGR